MSQIEYIALGALALLILVVMVMNLAKLFGTHRKRATLCEDAWLTHNEKPQGRCAWHGGIAKDE